MPKEFGVNERRICSLFRSGTHFLYLGDTYTVVFADKPVCARGEPKTDIFIRTTNSSGRIRDFKISYKQDNADFIENKTNAERAEQLFGADWEDIVRKSTRSLCREFESRPLIYKVKQGKTDKGAITLGWKFELLRVHSGALSGIMDLTYQQKVDVYAGTNLAPSKRNAMVNGSVVSNSGVAQYVFEEVCTAHSAQDVIDNMQTIDEFLEKYPHIYFACKALNYRTFSEKYDGNRPLSVFVDWSAVNGRLNGKLNFDAPLVTCGDEVFEQLDCVLSRLLIRTTDDITQEMMCDPSIVLWR